MSTSPSTPRPGTLTIAPATDAAPLAFARRIQVTDARLELAAKGFGTLTTAVPAGVYRVMVESAGEPYPPYEESVVVLPGRSRSVSYPVPIDERFSSAAPVRGASGMHEYVRGPLAERVERPLAPGCSCRVIVMATRQSNPPALKPVSLAGCALWAENGTATWQLDALAERDATMNVWAMVTIDLAPGGHVLEWGAVDGDPACAVRQPLWVPANWVLLVFLSVPSGADAPDMRSPSIHLAPVGRAFVGDIYRPLSAADEAFVSEQTAAELALASLREGRLLLSFDQLDQFLLGRKFQDPMLGIAGAYLLLQHQADSSLLDEVLRNLQNLVPGHPDLAALAVLAGQPRMAPPLHSPPMFGRGYVRLRHDDWDGRLFAPESLADLIRGALVPDGVWTRWQGNPSAATVGLAFAVELDPKPKEAAMKTPTAWRDLGREMLEARAGEVWDTLERKVRQGGIDLTLFQKTALNRWSEWRKHGKFVQPLNTNEVRLITEVTEELQRSPDAAKWIAVVGKIVDEAMPAVPSQLAQQIAVYAERTVARRKRAVVPEDLRWTGLNATQAESVCSVMQAFMPAATKAVERSGLTEGA